jgi:hypothetical protein
MSARSRAEEKARQSQITQPAQAPQPQQEGQPGPEQARKDAPATARDYYTGEPRSSKRGPVPHP